MSGLRALVEDPRAWGATLRVKVDPPVALRKQNEHVTEAATAPEPEAVAALQARIATAARDEAWSSLSRRDLRQGCRVFLHPPAAPGRQSDVGPALLARATAGGRRAPLLALAEAYLDGFRADDPDVAALGARLERLLEGRTDLGAWPERAAKWRLFDVGQGPGRLAAAVLAGTAPPNVVLATAGLDTDVRRTGGLAEAAFSQACRLVARAPLTAAAALQSRLLDWSGTPSLAFPAQWPELAAALLLPWAVAEPPAPHKAALMAALERFGGGDPRLQPPRWSVVRDRHPEAYAVVMRWLTRASVLQFLDIVDRSLSNDPPARRMWAYRRAFWTSYLLADPNGRERAIQSAWIAFGPNAATLAQDAARRSPEAASLSAFGRTRHRTGDHSALIVEIGDLTIVDWSHSGKYNVWKRGDGGRPRLFQPRYEGPDLDAAPHRDSHVGASNYTWQRRLAGIIEERPFVSEKLDWRPRSV